MIAYATIFHHQRPIDVGGKQSDTSDLQNKNKEMWYEFKCDNFHPQYTN